MVAGEISIFVFSYSGTSHVIGHLIKRSCSYRQADQPELPQGFSDIPEKKHNSNYSKRIFRMRGATSIALMYGEVL